MNFNSDNYLVNFSNSMYSKSNTTPKFKITKKTEQSLDNNILESINKVPQNKLNLQDNNIKHLDFLSKFNDLKEQFNKNKNNNKKLADIIKNMRIIHGDVIQLYQDTLNTKSSTKNQQLLLNLSTLYTSINNIDDVIKNAERMLSKDNKSEQPTISNEENNNINKDIIKILKIDINPELPTIVLFYMDWCGHCRNFKPIWNEFDKLTNKKYINVVKTNNDKLVQKNNINGFPSVKFYTGSQIIDFNGERSVHGLADFINSILDVKACTPRGN